VPSPFFVIFDMTQASLQGGDIDQDEGPPRTAALVPSPLSCGMAGWWRAC